MTVTFCAWATGAGATGGHCPLEYVTTVCSHRNSQNSCHMTRFVSYRIYLNAFAGGAYSAPQSPRPVAVFQGAGAASRQGGKSGWKGNETKEWKGTERRERKGADGKRRQGPKRRRGR